MNALALARSGWADAPTVGLEDALAALRIGRVGEQGNLVVEDLDGGRAFLAGDAAVLKLAIDGLWAVSRGELRRFIDAAASLLGEDPALLRRWWDHVGRRCLDEGEGFTEDAAEAFEEAVAYCHDAAEPREANRLIARVRAVVRVLGEMASGLRDSFPPLRRDAEGGAGA